MNHVRRLVAGLALAGASALVWAEYPDKPITLVVPFAAGGPTDKIARDLAEVLRKPLGQTVIVDNTVGAGGTIGSAKVARAPADGYTLLVNHIGMATAPSLYRKLTYKVPEDFETLGLINEAPSVLIGKNSLAAKNFAELRQWMREGGIRARHKRRFKATTDSRHSMPVAENLLECDFSPTAPNQVWTGDITYIATGEGWLYLAVVLDFSNRQVVG